MSERWDDWESGLYLEHHGIKGMSWGVRRYQNEDGSLTALGEKRYGKSGEGRSARKMARDFNKLDKGYANVVADQRLNARKTAKLSRKMHKAERKGNLGKASKLKVKALKVAKEAAKNNKQLKAIEGLQWKIIGKAATKGYTTKSKPVTRLGYDSKARGIAGAARGIAGAARGIAGAANLLLGGGAVGAGVASGILASRAQKVSGQHVKISKRGDGKTSIVNYNEGKKYEQEQRAREAAERRKHYHNR